MKQLFKLISAMMLLMSSLLSWGQSFSGSGSGTESDPYLIYNPNHLNDVHNFIGQSGVVFKLMQDIDLSSWLAENNPTNGWLPIGTEAQPFKGKFLGNNKTISGLFITRTSSNDVGFFGRVNGATISNLTINGSTISGADHTGGLCGIAVSSTISSCHVTIGVTGSTTHIGGFVGNNEGCTITNCSYTGSVNGPSCIAGFSGYAKKSNLTNITINANVTSTDTHSGQCFGYIGTGTTTITNVQAVGKMNVQSNAGGLVGRARTGCVLTIKNSSVNSNITGTTQLGGIIGSSEADELTITNCKSTGNINGTSYLGGIVGYNSSQATVSTTYHDGSIDANEDYVGGLIGQTVNIYNITSSGHIDDIKGRSYVSGGVGCSLKTGTTTTYTTDKNYSQANNTIECMLSDCYAVGDITSTGDGVGGLFGYSKSYFIENVYLSINLPSYILYKSYSASKDYSDFANGSYPYQSIYMYTINGTTYYSHKSYTEDDFLGCSFSRTTIWDPNYETFYKLSTRASGTINTTYKLSENHRMLAELSNSYYSGDISGNNYVGGIIGYGDMINLNTSYSNGIINANGHVGGIAGRILSSIVFNDVPVSKITSCVSANEVIVGIAGNTGRIYGSIGNNVTIGQTGATSANKGLATAKVTSAGATVDLSDSPQQGTNVGASTLRRKANYTGMGWDFDNYWKIQETECYPYKASQCAPPKITSQLVAGATSVSGQSIDGGTVVLVIGDNSYIGAVSSNQWTINVPGGLQSGSTIKACATKTGLMQSYYTTGVVGFAGSGTEDNPYLIYTASDLANINSYSYYKIMNDIDVSGWITANSPTTGWIPVGMNSGVSMKQLDGNGKTISGFWTNTTTNYYGLISTTNNAIIKDLTINLSKNSKVGANSAVLVGKSNNSNFSNIVVTGNIQGGDCLGAIVGYGSSNTFENCKVTSNVTSSGWAGGISGYSTSSSFSNCTYNGTLTGGNFVGGIAGGNNTSNSFTLCQVTGSVSGSRYVGGITSTCSNTISKCKTEATLAGKDYVGGIVGTNYTPNTSQITECLSMGTITATATGSNNCYAGGIAGENKGSIINSYSTVEVTSAEYGAGIAGINYGTIDKCYAAGNIYADKWGAGITGYNDGNGASVTNCFAANNKIQVSEAGGIGMRMIGGFRNGASEPNNSNFALNSMVVSINNVTKIVYDDPLEGIAVGIDALMSASTYTARGWDFTDVWGIEEGEGYPYLLALIEQEETPDVIPGDVNGDNTVNVSDYVTTASYILEQNPQPFIFEAADLDESGIINVTDLVGVAAIALTFEQAPRFTPALSVNAESGMLQMAAEMENNVELTIDLNNGMDITALQMDLTLPQGVTVEKATLTDRASASHTTEVAQLNNGDYRVLVASGALRTFKGHDGAVLRIKLSSSPESALTLHNIQLASPKAEGFNHEDIVLAPIVTAANDINAETRIYAENGRIVVETPADGQVLMALPNGMSVTCKVKAGHNLITPPTQGIVMVKMNEKVVKVKI